MKISLKLAAVALALGLSSPALSQASAPRTGNPAPTAAVPASPQQSLPAAPKSEPLPPPPSAISDPEVATVGDEPPSNAQVAQATVASRTMPTPGIGQPDGRFGFQDQVTPIGEEAAWFHNVILMPLITAISLLVLVLLLWVVVRYRRSANPVPSRTSHNTLIEVLWTLVPVLILVAIAVPSIRLLANQYSPPKADLTVKVVGNQWYWTYQYPDNGDFEVVSNAISDADADKRGEPRQLAVDERMVVPAGATVKLIVTSADVLHSWGVPAFWVKMDAVPGRLNETWFKTDRPGLYYGVCFELCGARHGYMPVAVEVLPPAQFAAWVRSKGGTLPSERRPTSSEATVNSSISNPGAATPTAGSGATETTPDLGDNRIIDVTTGAPASSQGATNSRRGGSQ
ncbi:MAG TPA: cytochrome c oxidase subunit II [Allosphingosinicella sp.]|jgi:cytochrome c oxidase subunit 2|uniref:cytochrome c oxidase subunit II n=1 Tax=Allosphingosinicella sp. TaxID=2823234 RepID=UPI002F2780E4